MEPVTFTLTELHLRLLRRMYVGWQDCESGAPEIDPKRPYGNSNVADDVSEICGRPIPRDRAMELHSETQTALQIVLVTGEFAPGEFVQRDRYDVRSWVRLEKPQ